MWRTSKGRRPSGAGHATNPYEYINTYHGTRGLDLLSSLHLLLLLAHSKLMYSYNSYSRKLNYIFRFCYQQKVGLIKSRILRIYII